MTSLREGEGRRGRALIAPCAAALLTCALMMEPQASAQPAPTGETEGAAQAPAPPVPPALPAPDGTPPAEAQKQAQEKPPKAVPPGADGTSPKRKLVDYDGREEPTTVEDVAIWIPRVILFPAYVVTEYVVRKPLGFVVTAAERGRLIQEITELFTFGPDKGAGIVPTAVIDFGFRASAGVYFFYDDLGAKGNDLRVHAATGGTDWLRLTVADRIAYGEDSYVKFRAEGWTRPDWAFFGLGPESVEANRSRYVAKSLEGGFSFYTMFKGASSFEAYSDVKGVGFGDGTCCDDPTLRTRVAMGQLELPPAFETGYTAYRLGMRLAFDSRRPRPEPGSGVRLELSGEHAFDLEDAKRRWLRYGAALGGFLDITGQNRVVSLSASVHFADPLGERDVPFTELATLGGGALMRGFVEGRMIGRSAAVATLEYRYPIWAFLDGTLQAAVGNVFGEHLSGFDPELLRLSFVAGVRTSIERDHSFDLLVGSGTETFKQGAGLHDVRFLFGATRGF